MRTEEAIEILRSEGKKVVLVHANADMDALGSAYALSLTFGPMDIYAPASLDRVTKIVAEKLEIPVIDECDYSSYDRVIVVDTSSPEQLERAPPVPEDALIIDHHTDTGKWDAERAVIDETRTSCCEIVKELIDTSGVEMPREAGLVLLGGMLTDSGHFQYADSRTLKAFGEIMERCGIPMDEAMVLMKAPVNMNEKQAAMRAIGRSKFERVGDMIVAVSTASSFEAACCRALIASGADVAFVGSQRDDQFRVSGRATQEAVRRGICLDEIVGSLSKETFTDGGGHGGAAGMTGQGDTDAMLHMCEQITMDIFREIKREREASGEAPSRRRILSSYEVKKK